MFKNCESLEKVDIIRSDFLYNTETYSTSSYTISEIEGKEYTLAEALIDCKLASSKREAREFIRNGAVLINGDKITDDERKDTEAMVKELKEAIDKLGEKIESLTADLHVAQESLTAKDEEIKALTIFNDDLYIDNAFLLTPANCAVEESVLKALAEWRFTKLYSNGSIQKGAASAQPEPEQKSTVAPVESPKISADVSKNTETVDASEFLGEDDYNKPLESSKPVVQETNTQPESKPEEGDDDFDPLNPGDLFIDSNIIDLTPYGHEG